MRNIYRISKVIILFILLINIVDAQVGTIGNMAQNNASTGFAKDLVVYLPESKVVDGINNAIIDILMQNPSNETMNVEINIIPPQDIFIYGGEGFTQSGANYKGDFVVDPGQNKTSEVIIKSDKTGNYSLDFNGQYWFNSSSSRFNIKPYTQVIEVKTPSINARGGNPNSPVTPSGIPDGNTITPQSSSTITPGPTKPIPYISIGSILLIISIVYLYKKIKVR